jgi:hypothetical protein
MGLFKFNWFTIWAIISIVSVFGAFIVVTVEALWLNRADVLFPIKIAIPVGYGAILLHMSQQIFRYMRSREAESAVVASIELLMLGGSVYALQGSILGFYGRQVTIGLGEEILPFDVRVVATVALVLPALFLVAAGYAFVLAVVFIKLFSGIGETLKRVAQTAAKPNLVFEFETDKAHLIEVEDQIFQVVDRLGVRRVADKDIPQRESLGPAGGPYFHYRLRVPLLTQIDQGQVDTIAASVPHGVRVRLENP